MLEVANLEVVYNDVVLVLRGLSLNVPDGEIIALLGANGAGKTTTLRAITGILDIHEGDITKGSVAFDGERIDGKDPAAIVKMGIAQVLEGRRIFAEMTVDDNLRTGAFTNSNKASVAAAHERVMDLFPVLQGRRKDTAGYLSGGEQIRDIIVDINRQGTSVLLIEQNANMALSIANYGYIMETGKVVMDGDPQKLLGDEDVKEFYLGLHGEGERKSFRDVKHYKRRKRWLS
jgi:branched-chain amino acid transport system ATP-binding protein